MEKKAQKCIYFRSTSPGGSVCILKKYPRNRRTQTGKYWRRRMKSSTIGTPNSTKFVYFHDFWWKSVLHKMESKVWNFIFYMSRWLHSKKCPKVAVMVCKCNLRHLDGKKHISCQSFGSDGGKSYLAIKEAVMWQGKSINWQRYPIMIIQLVSTISRATEHKRSKKLIILMRIFCIVSRTIHSAYFLFVYSE